MAQVKFYKYIIFSLVALNMVVLAFFGLTKPRPPFSPATKDLQSEVVDILDLDNQQESAFRASADKHRRKVDAISKQQEKFLLSYFTSISDPSKSSDNENLLSQFQQLEKEKIDATYHHFEEIKELLNKEQLPSFEPFMNKVLHRLLLDEKKKPPHPKDFH